MGMDFEGETMFEHIPEDPHAQAYKQHTNGLFCYYRGFRRKFNLCKDEQRCHRYQYCRMADGPACTECQDPANSTACAGLGPRRGHGRNCHNMICIQRMQQSEAESEGEYAI